MPSRRRLNFSSAQLSRGGVKACHPCPIIRGEAASPVTLHCTRPRRGCKQRCRGRIPRSVWQYFPATPRKPGQTLPRKNTCLTSIFVIKSSHSGVYHGVYRSTWQKRTLSLALAVCYGLALTTSGLLHDHGGSGPGATCTTSDLHDHVGGGIHSSSARSDSPHSQPERGPADSSQCAVCKFLGQKTLAVAATTEVVSVACSRLVAPPAAPQCVSPGRSSWHSRAPPDVA
jgi:hypothetical protein